jgi:sulfotransferase family protein
MSRSGGTLMVTLLDAHSDVAMSYELYPFLLEIAPDYDLEALAKRLAKSTDKHEIDKAAPSPGFVTFVKRSLRGGLSYNDFGRLLLDFLNEGNTLAEPEGRMRLVELCGLEKMKRLGKKRWGMKCLNDFESYLAVWPRSCFLDMLRDGRDVLASQLNTGNFKHSPEEVAKGWQTTHRRFQELIDSGRARARMVRYETLASDPEPELKTICEVIGLPFDPAMLHHEELDLTIFKVNHLSGPRISRAIDTTMIGRWRKDLSADQLAEFVSVAGDDLARYGYALSEPAEIAIADGAKRKNIRDPKRLRAHVLRIARDFLRRVRRMQTSWRLFLG